MGNAAQAILTLGIIGGVTFIIAKRRQELQAAPASNITPAAFTVTTTKSTGPNLRNSLLGTLGGLLQSATGGGGTTVESTGGRDGGFLSGIFGGGGQTTPGKSTSTTPPEIGHVRGFGSLDPLLSLIRKHESRNNYDAYFTGVSSPPPRRLTTMSINEVLAWQDRIDRTSPSEAAGAYQILEDTLRGLMSRGKVFGGDDFDRVTQDSLAKELLFGRGLQKYRSGQISAETFANNIAKEWASFPVVTGANKGRSFYAGDGLNRAGVSVSKSLSAVRAI